MRRKGHLHATLARAAFPGADVDVVTTVGGLYTVNSLAYSASDPAPARRSVVIDVPTGLFGRIMIVTRTSDTAVAGVESPVDLLNGLDLAGVFSELHSVDQTLWHGGNVTPIGNLSGAVLDRVLERFL